MRKNDNYHKITFVFSDEVRKDMSIESNLRELLEKDHASLNRLGIFDEVFNIIGLKRPPEIVDFEIIEDKPLQLQKP